MVSILIESIKKYSYEELIKQSSQTRIIYSSKYRDMDSRKRTLLGELLLRRALKDFGKPFKGMKRDNNGKPYVDLEGFYFNISHSGEFVILAYSDVEVGVDIEKIKSRNIDNIVGALHDREKEYISNSQRLEDLYRIWTLKESYLKLTGYVHKNLKSFYILPNLESNLDAHFNQIKYREYILSVACYKPFKYIISD